MPPDPSSWVTHAVSPTTSMPLKISIFAKKINLRALDWMPIGKKKPEKKNQGFNGIRTRDLRDTGAMLYQLSYEATHWERGQFIEFISSRAVKWREVLYLSNWKIYCDDHSSLSSITAVQIWIISYKTSRHFTVREDMNSINWPRSQCVAS